VEGITKKISAARCCLKLPTSAQKKPAITSRKGGSTGLANQLAAAHDAESGFNARETLSIDRDGALDRKGGTKDKFQEKDLEKMETPFRDESPRLERRTIFGGKQLNEERAYVKTSTIRGVLPSLLSDKAKRKGRKEGKKRNKVFGGWHCGGGGGSLPAKRVFYCLHEKGLLRLLVRRSTGKIRKIPKVTSNNFMSMGGEGGKKGKKALHLGTGKNSLIGPSVIKDRSGVIAEQGGGKREFVGDREQPSTTPPVDFADIRGPGKNRD